MSPVVSARGRGARSNASGRFESERVEAFDDGWGEGDAPAPQLATTLTAERARTIISRNTSPDVAFDQAINTYRGCEHGCIYCYARPNHAYVGLSPGIDFERTLFFKPDAPALLARELGTSGYVCRPLHVGGVTDVYQPAERTLRLTRACLEVLQACGHPFSVISKSALIARDADILGDMGRRGLARAYVSITTLDRRLARDMEPRAATPERRLQAIRALAEAGTPVGVGFAPVIPGLNDHEMEAVLERAREAGATAASFILLRLPREIAGLFKEWLAEARPDRAERVMSLVRQTRGGRENDPRFVDRMTGSGPVAELLRSRFRLACRKLGLNTDRRPLRTDLFRPPGAAAAQLELFG